MCFKCWRTFGTQRGAWAIGQGPQRRQTMLSSGGIEERSTSGLLIDGPGRVKGKSARDGGALWGDSGESVPSQI